MYGAKRFGVVKDKLTASEPLYAVKLEINQFHYAVVLFLSKGLTAWHETNLQVHTTNLINSRLTKSGSKFQVMKANCRVMAAPQPKQIVFGRQQKKIRPLQ